RFRFRFRLGFRREGGRAGLEGRGPGRSEQKHGGRTADSTGSEQRAAVMESKQEQEPGRRTVPSREAEILQRERRAKGASGLLSLTHLGSLRAAACVPRPIDGGALRGRGLSHSASRYQRARPRPPARLRTRPAHPARRQDSESHMSAASAPAGMRREAHGDDDSDSGGRARRRRDPGTQHRSRACINTKTRPKRSGPGERATRHDTPAQGARLPIR
ncbi:hypothetical protein FB567DRAFT_613545, partial [Paraphoma chrysanthemicola]